MTSKRSLLDLFLIVLLASCNSRTLPAAPTGTPTANPSPSVTPSMTPTPTLTPTLTPSSTPIPEVRVENGEKALFNGDYGSADEEFRIALNTATDPQVRATALWGLGRVEHIFGNNTVALEDLRLLSSEYPSSPDAAHAYFLTGEIYSSLLRYPEAVQAYTTYLSLRPGVIDYYVQERRGDALNAIGNYADAITAYQAALNAPHINDDMTLQIKLAGTFASNNDYTTALGLYDKIATATQDDYVKAQIDLLEGRLYYSSLGQTDLAYQHYLDAVNNYPASYDSYSALLVLVNDGKTVDDLNRGLVDYFAGQYGLALEYFNRYIAANPQQDGTANYYIALTLLAQDQYQQAVDAFTDFIAKYPSHKHWQDAWEEKADIQYIDLDQYEEAVQTLRNYIHQTTEPSPIPTTMQTIAYIYEYGELFDKAASAWEDLANAYPGGSLSPLALFKAGIDRYRIGQYSQALVDFQRDVLLSTDVEDQARAYFWIGKAQQILGDSASAQATWRQAATLSSSYYYSLRSQDMLFNRPVFESPLSTNLKVDLTAERSEAESWLRVTFGLPPDTDLSAPGPLASDPRLVRGTELWKLGLYDEARLEFEDLRTAVGNDPANSFRLANTLLDLGVYRSAIDVIENQLLPLAGMTSDAQMLTAPAYFKHVRFGVYFSDLVVPAAQQNGFDPLFLFSVIRQESQFEGFASSSKGAQGLMQITPDTGQFIANNMNWPPNYTTEDLNRPLVSIDMGAYYLKTNQLRFDGDLYATLTAYNRGPNDPQIPAWQEASGGDIDLFLEMIAYGETRNYIRGIYETYCVYRSLYGVAP